MRSNDFQMLWNKNERLPTFKVGDKAVAFNLSTTKIYVVTNRHSCLDKARESYFQLRCAAKIHSRKWIESKKRRDVFRYHRDFEIAAALNLDGGWKPFSERLKKEGIDFFFNRKIFDAFFVQTDVRLIVESLYKNFLARRPLASDRSAGAALDALFCLHAAGSILLPVGWSSPYGGISKKWPGSKETLSYLLNVPEVLFNEHAAKELAGVEGLLKDKPVGGNKKRQVICYKAIKLILSALPAGTRIGNISGDMFIALTKLLVDMRDQDREEPLIRDRKIGDLRLIWNVIAPFRKDLSSAKQETQKMYDFITSYASRTGDEADRENRRRERGHQMRKEGDLRWVIEEAPELEEIVTLGRDYIRTATTYIVATTSRGFEKLFEYLIDRPKRPSSLSELKREDFQPGKRRFVGFPSFTDYIRTCEDIKRNKNRGSNKGDRSDDQLNMILNSVLNFLEWYRDRIDNEFHVPLYRSEIPPQSRRGRNGKTTKLPVPIRVLSLCRKILTENDYAWPRSLRDDYTLVTDADATTVKRWWPGRAIAMLMLFTVPIRGASVRRLDSGEGDENFYDSKSKKWFPNLLSTAEKGRTVGVVHRVLEMADDGKPLNGLFINSNKTQRAKSKLTSSKGANKSAFQFGYVIPWDNAELIGHLAYCRDWQIEYNPVAAPRGLDTVVDSSMRVTAAVARMLPDLYFLFRDPNQGNEPVSPFKLNAMFDQLLDEASRRISLEDGEAIDLKQFYTLHSLRVGGITAFMKAGTPLSVLTEFMAGHATWIMNVYYQRHSAPELSRVISDAFAALESGDLMEDDLFERLKRISDDIEISDTSVVNAQGLIFRDSEAIRYLKSAQKGLVLIDIDGCCPVGGSMCDQGGPVDNRGEAGYNLLGQHGCPTCRFHVTGEPFLAGMVIKSNETMHRLRGMANAIQQVEEELEQCPPNNRGGKRRVLQSRLDGLNLMAEQLMIEWSSRVQSIMLTTGQMASVTSQPIANKTAVMVANRHVIFEEGSEFRLVDFLARATEFMKLNPTVESEVRLRRRVMLDQLLNDNGASPFLFSLSDQYAHKSCNRLVDLLVEAVGWQGMDATIERRISLEEIGLTQEQIILIERSGRETDGIARSSRGHIAA